MCEANAFILKDGNEEMFLENVDLVKLEGDEINPVSIFGEQNTLKAKLKLYDNTKRKIVFELL
ncbi:MAG: CooT family nickel-binding protein [Thermodesulfobacteriota bacterium]|nr:CooT family nickel-binding protein [Thermodesulfobacteriota bacterium]